MSEELLRKIGRWLDIAYERDGWASPDMERDISLLKSGKMPDSVYYGAEKWRTEKDVKDTMRKTGRKYYK